MLKRDLDKWTVEGERFLPLFPEIHLSSLPNSNRSTLRRQLHWYDRGLSAFVEGGRVFPKGGEEVSGITSEGGWCIQASGTAVSEDDANP
jgi:hypothetical protein